MRLFALGRLSSVIQVTVQSAVTMINTFELAVTQMAWIRLMLAKFHGVPLVNGRMVGHVIDYTGVVVIPS